MNKEGLLLYAYNNGWDIVIPLYVLAVIQCTVL